MALERAIGTRESAIIFRAGTTLMSLSKYMLIGFAPKKRKRVGLEREQKLLFLCFEDSKSKNLFEIIPIFY